MQLPIVVSVALALLATNAPLLAETGPVGFDWFEYSGTNAPERKADPGEFHNPPPANTSSN